MMKRADFFSRQCFLFFFSQWCISYYNNAFKCFTAIIFFSTDMHNDGTWYIRKQGNLMADYHRYSYTNDLSSCIIKQPCYLRHGVVHLGCFYFLRRL